LEHPGKYGGSMLSGFGAGREVHIVGRKTEEENRRRKRKRRKIDY
jgi:hypothetical protein